MHQGKIPLGIIDSINERWGTLISYLVLLMMGVTAFEVVSRYVFNRPTFWAHETCEMLYGAFIMLGAGYTLRHRASPAHIKMDLFYMRFSPRKKAVIDLVASIIFFIFVGAVLWMGWQMAWRSTQMGEHTMTTWGPPIYPVKWCIPVGAFLLLVQGVAKFIRDFNTAMTGGKAA